MGSFLNKNEKNEEYVNVGIDSTSEEYTMIIQHVRKNLLLKQFNEYIKNTNQHSVYHKYYVNTKEIETLNNVTKEYKVMSTIFYTLWSIDVSSCENDNVIEWIN